MKMTMEKISILMTLYKVKMKLLQRKFKQSLDFFLIFFVLFHWNFVSIIKRSSNIR